MKTDVITIDNKGDYLQAALDRIEGLAKAQPLSSKNSLYLRLIAEELFGIVSAEAGDFTAKFWAENEGNDYRVVLEADAKDLSEDAKKDLISISSTGENTNNFGIMDKVGSLFSFFAKGGDTGSAAATFGYGYNTSADDVTWSLKEYKAAVKDKNLDAPIEAMSKSVVANVADDVVVGVKDKKVKIEIFKTFA